MEVRHSSRQNASPKRPSPPEWDTCRPFLTGSALHDARPLNAVPLSTFPSSSQQVLAVEDALHALLGMRTSYTTFDSSKQDFSTDGNALRHSHPEIAPLLARVLPLASHHAVVSRFVEESQIPRTGSGYVLQAIGVALAELLNEYRALVLQLETALRKGELPLQKLLYYVQPSVRSMALLRSVVEACKNKNGGAALDAVYKLAVAHVGADDLRDVLSFVVGKAAAPIFSIMDGWIRTGVVDDPFEEFFVQEDERYAPSGDKSGTIIISGSAWELRYTVNRENLPDFLAPFVQSILRSGKYLNVLRGCGLDTARVTSKMAEKTGQSAGFATERSDGRFSHLHLSGKVLLGPDASRRIAEVVENSFKVSSRALMEYLDEEIRILGRLRSLRRYFLLDQSDFLVNFFDAASSELSKRRRDVSRGRLSSLLELSIRTSVSKSDPFQDDVRCMLCPEDFASQIVGMSGPSTSPKDSGSISGYEAFAIDYHLEWPTTLVVSEVDVLKYQFIFRYLFYCKYVERELEECWRHQSQMKGPLRKAPRSFVRSFALRNRMLQFVRNILYYTTADVLEPNWRALESGVRKSATVDELMQHHAQFLDLSVEQSLLSNEKHLKVFKNVSETCISFAAYTEKFSSLFGAEQSSDEIEEDLRGRNYPTTLAKFETAFDMHLGKLLDGLSAVSKKRANAHLSNLCDRLDIDGFYSRSTERSLASYGM